MIRKHRKAQQIEFKKPTKVYQKKNGKIWKQNTKGQTDRIKKKNHNGVKKKKRRMVKYDNKTQKAKQKDFKQHTKVYQRFETRSKRYYKTICLLRPLSLDQG